VLSTLFEGLVIDGTIVIGTLFVLAGNLFVLKTREPGTKQPASTPAVAARKPSVDVQHLIFNEAKS
jgi:hypothetical protein